MTQKRTPRALLSFSEGQHRTKAPILWCSQLEGHPALRLSLFQIICCCYWLEHLFIRGDWIWWSGYFAVRVTFVFMDSFFFFFLNLCWCSRRPTRTALKCLKLLHSVSSGQRAETDGRTKLSSFLPVWDCLCKLLCMHCMGFTNSCHLDSFFKKRLFCPQNCIFKPYFDAHIF